MYTLWLYILIINGVEFLTKLKEILNCYSSYDLPIKINGKDIEGISIENNIINIYDSNNKRTI